MAGQRILFVTGRLAESSLRGVLEECSQQVGFEYDVAVLGISVAALMHADWVQRKLEVPSDFDRIILPGWCQGSVERLGECYGTEFELGPKDLRNLPEFLGQDGKEMQIGGSLHLHFRLEDLRKCGSLQRRPGIQGVALA